MILPFVKTSCKNSTAKGLQRLMEEIRTAQSDMEQARKNFENASDPSLIDCFIYEENAAAMRHQYLMRRAKSMNLTAR